MQNKTKMKIVFSPWQQTNSLSAKRKAGSQGKNVIVGVSNCMYGSGVTVGVRSEVVVGVGVSDAVDVPVDDGEGVAGELNVADVEQWQVGQRLSKELVIVFRNVKMQKTTGVLETWPRRHETSFST